MRDRTGRKLAYAQTQMIVTLERTAAVELANTGWAPVPEDESREKATYFAKPVGEFLYERVSWYRRSGLKSSCPFVMGSHHCTVNGVALELAIFPSCAFAILNVSLPLHSDLALDINYEISFLEPAHKGHLLATLEGETVASWIQHRLPPGLKLDPRYRRGYLLTYLVLPDEPGATLDDQAWVEKAGNFERSVSTDHLVSSHKPPLNYQRWASSRYVFTRSGTAVLALANEMTTGFLPTYVFGIYRDMASLSLYQHRLLARLSEALAAIDSLVRSHGLIRKIHWDFLSFTNTTWFSEVTDFEYGQTLWQYWQESLRIKEAYGEITRQLQEIDAYISNLKSYSLNWRVSVLTGVALPLNMAITLVGVKLQWGWPLIAMMIAAYAIIAFFLFDWSVLSRGGRRAPKGHL